MRYFTVQEANAFVPALEAAFDDIQQLRRRVIHLARELAALGVQVDLSIPAEATPLADDLPDGVRLRRAQVASALSEIRRRVGELEAHGLIVKQLDGRVEFCSLRGQRPVYLSWTRGEDRVEQWHEAWSEGDRHPVDGFFKKPQLN